MNDIKIVTQIWMSENLNVDCFSNGDPIPEAKTKEIWIEAGNRKEPVWCLYKNTEFLGKLYNWHAISDARGLAPDGWLLSTRNDWETLFEYIGGTKLAGKKLKNNSSSWEEFGGDDDFNFSVFPARIEFTDLQGVTMRISSFFSGNEKTIPYSQISSVSIVHFLDFHLSILKQLVKVKSLWMFFIRVKF